MEMNGNAGNDWKLLELAGYDWKWQKFLEISGYSGNDRKQIKFQ